ncbi:MAG TPA: YfdX family protein [Gammaproteobacteria bacterium]|nr:YfdX family protein [Gammaproteobacteria bacterium]
MKTMTYSAVKPAVLVLAAVLATGAVAVTAEAAGKGNSETISISEYTDWGDPAMAKIAIDSGRALIAHLSTARALIDSGQIAEARSALNVSREFADTIERTMPYLTVVEDMMDVSKRVVEEDVAALSEDLLPIYASIDELQVYAPEVAERTRGALKQVKKHAAAGNKKRASQVLAEAADDITRSTVYLPVGYVDVQTRVALYALNMEKPDVTAARSAVDLALDSVTTVVNEVITSVN